MFGIKYLILLGAVASWCGSVFGAPPPVGLTCRVLDAKSRCCLRSVELIAPMDWCNSEIVEDGNCSVKTDLHGEFPGRRWVCRDMNRSSAASKLPQANPLDFDRMGVKKFIEGNHIASVDEFLKKAWASAPENPGFSDLFLQRHQFVAYKSGSKQRSSETDPKNPRVILVSTGAKFMLAFSSLKPTLEMIQFNDQSREFEFRNVDFSGEKPQFLKHDALDDQTCRSCHAGRPNWDTYPLWPGFYGGGEGAGQGEQNLAKAFISAQPSIPVYEKLGSPGGSSFFLPLTGDLSSLNGKRVARILQNSKAQYSKYKFAMLAALSRCKDIESFVQPRAGTLSLSETLADTKRRHLEYYEFRTKQLLEEAGIPRSNRPNIEETEDISRVRFIAQYFDLSGTDKFDYWSLSRPNRDLDIDPGYFMAFKNPSSNSLDQMSQSLQESDLELARVPKSCVKLKSASESSLRAH